MCIIGSWISSPINVHQVPFILLISLVFGNWLPALLPSWHLPWKIPCQLMAEEKKMLEWDVDDSYLSFPTCVLGLSSTVALLLKASVQKKCSLRSCKVIPRSRTKHVPVSQSDDIEIAARWWWEHAKSLSLSVLYK